VETPVHVLDETRTPEIDTARATIYMYVGEKKEDEVEEEEGR
jgi:hypothetical protein